jgi:hypothetical protein
MSETDASLQSLLGEGRSSQLVSGVSKSAENGCGSESKDVRDQTEEPATGLCQDASNARRQIHREILDRLSVLGPDDEKLE